MRKGERRGDGQLEGMDRWKGWTVGRDGGIKRVEGLVKSGRVKGRRIRKFILLEEKVEIYMGWGIRLFWSSAPWIRTFSGEKDY